MLSKTQKFQRCKSSLKVLCAKKFTLDDFFFEHGDKWVVVTMASLRSKITPLLKCFLTTKDESNSSQMSHGKDKFLIKVVQEEGFSAWNAFISFFIGDQVTVKLAKITSANYNLLKSWTWSLNTHSVSKKHLACCIPTYSNCILKNWENPSKIEYFINAI